MEKTSKNSREIDGVWWQVLVASAVKLLLVPAYRSTDFEVHRNWLAITHSLPLSGWYSDSTSPWTLDYPPFFALFEKFLSIFASRVDPTMTHLQHGLNYASDAAVLFQRLSVIISDGVLVYSVCRLIRSEKFGKFGMFFVRGLVIWSPGLFIVDHIHFQYNGFLLGMLLLSISFLEEGKDVMGGFVFAVLLCFKHLFAVAAPLYLVYLFRHYCRGGWIKGFVRLMVMGIVVLAVFCAAFGPFVYYGQIQQVFHRMFPFGRGLCHAYWAPNFWVFYILLDKALAMSLVRLGFDIKTPKASFTGGLVGDSSPFAVLPTITPLITFAAVILALSPCLVRAWRNPRPGMIARWISYAYTCGFLFGWHVHEKASLHFVIPLAITSLQSKEDAKHFFFVSLVSCYSLFPLVFEAQEYPIMVILLLLHGAITWLGFSFHFSESSVKRSNNKSKTPAIHIGLLAKSYLFGFIVIEIWAKILHNIVFGHRLPFLPLMMASIYCAFGMMHSWIWQLRQLTQTN